MVELQQWRACVRGGLSLAARDCLRRRRRRPRLPLPSRRAAAATPPPAELAGRACEVVVVSRQHARQGEDGEEDGEDAMYMTCGDYSSGEKLFKNHLYNQTSFYLSHNYFFKANFQKNPHSYFSKKSQSTAAFLKATAQPNTPIAGRGGSCSVRIEAWHGRKPVTAPNSLV